MSIKSIKFFLAVSFAFAQQQELPVFNVENRVSELYIESKSLLMHAASNQHDTNDNRKKAAKYLIYLSLKGIFNHNNLDDAGYFAIQTYVKVARKHQQGRIIAKLNENHGREYVTEALNVEIVIPEINQAFIRNALREDFNRNFLDTALRLIRLADEHLFQQRQLQELQLQELQLQELQLPELQLQQRDNPRIENQLEERAQLEKEHEEAERAFNEAHVGNRQYRGPFIQQLPREEQHQRREEVYQIHQAIRDLNVLRGAGIRERRNNERNRQERIDFDRMGNEPRHIPRRRN
ncbi:MAG: hypothetical protein HEEMFOPI_01529 [Holosporales bacterium]